MRRAACAVLAGMAAVAASGPAAAASGRWDELPARVTAGAVYAVRQPDELVTAHCGQEVAPDLAVVVGALTARSLKPTEARARLEQQLEAVRAYVATRGGRLELGETIRAARSGPPQDGPGGDRPFIRVQRLEAVFGTDAPIDEILEGLLQLGLDQYGRDVVLEGADSRPRVVVRYRFRALGGALEAMRAACREAAWQIWRERAGSSAPSSPPPAGEPGGCRLRAVAFTVRSQPVLGEHGGSAPIELQHPWDPVQVERLELLGQVNLRLGGTLTAIVEGCRQP